MVEIQSFKVLISPVPDGVSQGHPGREPGLK